jgi:hypothetical protein
MTATKGTPLHTQGCLFCLRSDGGFTSREHVFSEGLGNHEQVLDPGVVCDRCNHGPLSKADEALVNFEAVGLRKGELGIPSKSGKPAVVKFGNATIFWSGPGQLEVVNPNSKAIRHMHKGTPGESGSHGQLNLHSGGPMTARRKGRIVRSVWKSAVESIYLNHGAEAAFDPILDEARHAVIDDTSHGWALILGAVKPTTGVWVQCEPLTVGDRPALATWMTVFGLEFYTDLLLRDPADNYYEPAAHVMAWEF